MDEPMIGDDDFQPADLDFDQQLRHRLAETDRPAAVHSTESERILAELRPRIVRARRVRRAQLVATVTGSVLLVIGGLVALPRLSSGVDRQSTVAGEPDEAMRSADDAADLHNTVHVSTTAPDRDPGDDPSDGAGAGPTSTRTGQQGLGPAASSAVTAESTQTTQTAPTTQAGQGTTTEPASTGSTAASTPTSSSTGGTTSVPGSVTVESACGSMVVVVVDASVELVEVLPDPGYRADVKSEGREVEVSLEGRDGHCELKAEFERGELKTSSEDEHS